MSSYLDYHNEDNELQHEDILNKVIRKIMNAEYYRNYRRKWATTLNSYDNLDYENRLVNEIKI